MARIAGSRSSWTPEKMTEGWGTASGHIRVPAVTPPRVLGALAARAPRCPPHHALAPRLPDPTSAEDRVLPRHPGPGFGRELAAALWPWLKRVRMRAFLFYFASGATEADSTLQPHSSTPSASTLNSPGPSGHTHIPLLPSLWLLPWASPLLHCRASSLSSNHSYFQEGGVWVEGFLQTNPRLLKGEGARLGDRLTGGGMFLAGGRARVLGTLCLLFSPAPVSYSSVSMG